VQWLVICWLLVRWIRLRDDRLLLVLGVVGGVAAQTKFQVMLLGVVLLLAVAVAGPRDLLRRPALWVGVAVAVAIAAPTLLWQAANGWPQLAMGAVVAAEVDAQLGGRPGVLALWVVHAGPVAAVLIAVGLAGAFMVPALRPVRFLAVAFFLITAVFLVTSGRQYYLAGLYGVLAAVGAVALQRRREAGNAGRRWVARCGAVVGALLAVAVLGGSIVLSSPSYADAVIARTAHVYASLSPEERARTAVMTQPFTLAVSLDAASPALGLPPAASPSRAYGWFPPPPADHDRVLLVGDPAPLAAWFTTARRVEVIDAQPPSPLRWLLPPEPEIWSLSGRRAPWTTIWPQVRTLQV
jgi:hypothetical protein